MRSVGCQGKTLPSLTNVTEFPVTPRLTAAAPPRVPLQSLSEALIRWCAVSRKGMIRAETEAPSGGGGGPALGAALQPRWPSAQGLGGPRGDGAQGQPEKPPACCLHVPFGTMTCKRRGFHFSSLLLICILKPGV